MRMAGWMGLVAMLAVLSGPACAENLLGIAPLRVILNDQKTSDVLTLSNRSDSVRTYKVTMQDQVMGADGNVTQQPDFPYSAKRMLRFMPRQITLQPGERQTVRVMVMPPEGLEDGDYHTHLIFDEVVKGTTNKEAGATQGIKVSMGATYSVGLPLVYEHGKVESALRLTGARLVALKNGRVGVEVGLARSGNGEGTGNLKMVEEGREDVNLSQIRTVHVYREADAVTIHLPVRTTVEKSLQGLQAMNLKVMLDKDGIPVNEVPVEK